MNSVNIEIDEMALTNMILSYYGERGAYNITKIDYILSNIYDDLYIDRYYDGHTDIKPKLEVKISKYIDLLGKVEEKLSMEKIREIVSYSFQEQGYVVNRIDVLTSTKHIDFRDSYKKFRAIKVKAIENSRVRVR